MSKNSVKKFRNIFSLDHFIYEYNHVINPNINRISQNVYWQSESDTSSMKNFTI